MLDYRTIDNNLVIYIFNESKYCDSSGDVPEESILNLLKNVNVRIFKYWSNDILKDSDFCGLSKFKVIEFGLLKTIFPNLIYDEDLDYKIRHKKVTCNNIQNNHMWKF